MEARHVSDLYDDEPWELAAAFRVTLWEQPAWPPDFDLPSGGWGVPPGARMGWDQMTFELVGAEDIREAIKWAEAALDSGEGPASRRGVPVENREYVIYAKGRSVDRWLHVAGWPPIVPPGSIDR